MAIGALKRSDTNRAILEQEAFSAYLPVVRVFLAVVAAYYCVGTVIHLLTETGLRLQLMAGLAVISAITAYLAHHRLSSAQTMASLEVNTLVGNALLLANVILFFSFEFDSNRLVYFVLMVFIFAMASPTRRVAAVSSIAALIALHTTVQFHDPELTQQYVFIGIASCFAALGGSLVMRRIIHEALDAKLLAAQKELEAREAAAHATRLAVTDSLSDLPNRRAFFEQLKSGSAVGGPDAGTLAVLLVDLDGFKPINDTYGHAAGDQLLKAMAARLQLLVPTDTFLARLGGDEFAVLLSGKSNDEARAIGNAICDGMREPFQLEQTVVHVGASVGIAMDDTGTIPPHELVEQADFALFSIKRRQKGQCSVFTRDDADTMKHNVRVEQSLRCCDMEDELSMVYQPQIDILTNQITGYEALGRWQSRELGAVPPATFITVAESSALVSQVTQVLLAKALKEASTWSEHLSLAFNLSGHDILDKATINAVLRLSRESGVAPSRICFEVTETVVMSEPETAAETLQALVDAGHQIALDDFGTGYSNFSYLHRLPIDKIKIDRSLLHGVSTQSASTKVLSTLLQLTRSLHKDCIIEGVETDLELAAIKGLGARTVQGYYYGRPLPASDIDIPRKTVDDKADNVPAKTA